MYMYICWSHMWCPVLPGAPATTSESSPKTRLSRLDNYCYVHVHQCTHVHIMCTVDSHYSDVAFSENLFILKAAHIPCASPIDAHTF